MRVLHYAIGGGLGHLVRARAFLDAAGLDREALVLSASPHAADPRVLGQIAAARVPDALAGDREALRDWLAERIDAHAPELVVVDAFPCGIRGELAAFAPLLSQRCWHLARLLRWDAYASAAVLGAPPRYERVLRLEPLAGAHETFLRGCAERIDDFALAAPADARAAPIDAPYWLVVHSGPESEVAELIAYACERRAIERAGAAILVASPSAPHELPLGCAAIDVHPARGLFARAERIVSAAGFNVMREAAPYRGKHEVIPFPRRFDDQFERARRHRARCAVDAAIGRAREEGVSR